DDVIAQSLNEIVEGSAPPHWAYQFNYHRNAAQALVSSSDTPATLSLETREIHSPYRQTSVTLWSDPPMGYRLVFAQNERVGLVRDTGFFFQDRWRSLF